MKKIFCDVCGRNIEDIDHDEHGEFEGTHYIEDVQLLIETHDQHMIECGNDIILKHYIQDLCWQCLKELKVALNTFFNKEQ